MSGSEDEFADSFVNASNDVDEKPLNLSATMKKQEKQSPKKNDCPMSKDHLSTSQSNNKKDNTNQGSPITQFKHQASKIKNDKKTRGTRNMSRGTTASFNKPEQVSRQGVQDNRRKQPLPTQNKSHQQKSIFEKYRKSDNQSALKSQHNHLRNMHQQSESVSIKGTSKTPQILISGEGEGDYSNYDTCLSDKSISKQKDFKAAYKMLQQKVISENGKYNSSKVNVAQALLGNSKSMKQIAEDNKKRESQTQCEGGGIDIYEKLYKDSNNYFKNKKMTRNIRLEEEIKQCTFSPNNKKHSSRSFSKLYNDIISAHLKTEERLSRMRQERQEQEMSEVRSFCSENSSCSPRKRALSPMELSQKLYSDGLESIKDKNYKTTTRDIGKLDKNYTFRPALNLQSKVMTKIKEQRQSKDVIMEVLHNEKLKKIKRNSNAKSFQKDSQTSVKTKENQQSQQYLEQRIEKVIMDALSQLQFDQEAGLNSDELFQMLKNLDYANENDDQFVKKVYEMVGQGNHLGFEELKIILCGIEKIYLKRFLSDKQIFPDFLVSSEITDSHQSQIVWNLVVENDFNKFHRVLQRLFLNKSQNEFKRKNLQIQNQNLSPKASFKPQLNRKSIVIESKKRESSMSKERNQILLEIGKQYDQSRLKKIEEKEDKELDGCSFTPLVNSDFNFKYEQNIQRHCESGGGPVYQKLHNLKSGVQRKPDKTKDEIEFEKAANDYTFKPNLDKPNILNLNLQNRQPLVQTRNTIKSPGGQFNQQSSMTSDNPFTGKLINPFVDKMASNNFNELRKQEICRKNLMMDDESAQGQIFRDCPPLLFLEVNISEGKQQKLVMYDGDNPDHIVEVFSQTYNLGLNKKKKLMEIVKLQLAKILQNIGEADEEDDEGTFGLRERDNNC